MASNLKFNSNLIDTNKDGKFTKEGTFYFYSNSTTDIHITFKII